MTVIFQPEVEARLKEEFFAPSRTGYFVEVGANDPEKYSETFHLEQLGWNGVLIEPQPDLADALRRRRKAKVYAVACSTPENAGKSMRLYVAGIYSSLDPKLTIATVRPERAIDVPVRTLDDILAEAAAPVPIDFVSIDAEGHDIEVLRGFNLMRWQPRLILIEDLALNLRLHRYLRARGYAWLRRTGLNAWYVPAGAAPRLGAFSQWQFVRKYYLGLPFRHLREALRRLRTRIKHGRPRPA